MFVDLALDAFEPGLEEGIGQIGVGRGEVAEDHPRHVAQPAVFRLPLVQAGAGERRAGDEAGQRVGEDVVVENLYPRIDLLRGRGLRIGDHQGEDAGIVVAGVPELNGEGVIGLDLLRHRLQGGVVDAELRPGDAVPSVGLACLRRAGGLQCLHRFSQVHERAPSVSSAGEWRDMLPSSLVGGQGESGIHRQQARDDLQSNS